MSGVLERLLAVAVSQHGFFTVGQAGEVGVGDDQVRRLAVKGVVERRAQGVYRVSSVPLGPYSEYIEAVLWTRGEGLIAGPSALVLWDLADVSPRRIHLAVETGARFRRGGADRYELHFESGLARLKDHVFGVGVVSVAAAIRQSIQWGTPGDLVDQAIGRAVAREHLGSESKRLLVDQLLERNRG